MLSFLSYNFFNTYLVHLCFIFFMHICPNNQTIIYKIFPLCPLSFSAAVSFYFLTSLSFFCFCSLLCLPAFSFSIFIVYSCSIFRFVFIWSLKKVDNLPETRLGYRIEFEMATLMSSSIFTASQGIMIYCWNLLKHCIFHITFH